jgi:hypothetical protein
MRSIHLGLSFAAAALIACSRTPSELSAGPESSAVRQPTPLPSAAMAPHPMVHPAASSAPRVLALRWNDPPRWQRRVPSTPMRAAEYRVPRAGSDQEDAECSVITFGPGQGGSVDDNIDRWVRQLQPASSAVERTKRSVNGMAVTRVEVAGTYTPMAMPGMPSSTTTPRQGQRLVGDIVEAPSGFWFFKMTGPDATVSAAAKELDSLIDSLGPT